MATFGGGTKKSNDLIQSLVGEIKVNRRLYFSRGSGQGTVLPIAGPISVWTPMSPARWSGK